MAGAAAGVAVMSYNARQQQQQQQSLAPGFVAPATVGATGKTQGARAPPGKLALFCLGPCAISGYVTGDPTEGMCEGPALISFILDIFTIVGGGIYAMACWQPDPSMLKGDTEQRTVQNKCCAACCAGGPCTVAFYQSGDLCNDLDGNCLGGCQGDAGTACMLEFVGAILGVPLAMFYVCCCWNPNPMFFKRSDMMHGGGRDQGVVGQAVAVAQGMANQVIGQVAQAAPVAAVATAVKS